MVVVGPPTMRRKVQMRLLRWDIQYRSFKVPVSIRRLLHRDHFWGVVPLGIGTAWAMTSFDQFGIARASLIITALWSIGFWLISDALRARTRALRAAQQRRTPEEFRHLVASYRRLKWGVISIIFLALCACDWFVRDQKLRKEFQSLQGRLYPASDVTPHPCVGERPGDVIIFYGNNQSLVSNFPHTVIGYNPPPPLNPYPAVVVDRDQDGIILLLLEVRSSDNRLIVKMDKTGFVVNQNNVLSMKPRTDRSTLIVVDQEGNTVINIRYANRSALIINGRFSIPGKGTYRLQLPVPNICVHNLGSGADIGIH